MDYDNTNSGTLWKNESDNEKAPMYRGKINVEGKEYEIAAWLREAKSGKGKFLSLKIQEPYKKPEAKKATFDDIDDSVPF
jgi:uncharacterized protein (DUF736 family)